MQSRKQKRTADASRVGEIVHSAALQQLTGVVALMLAERGGRSR